MKILITNWNKGSVLEQHRPIGKPTPAQWFIKTIFFAITIFFCLFQSPNLQAQCNPNCQNINLSLEASGYGLVDVATVLEEGGNCSFTEFTLTILDGNGSELSGNLIDCSYLGQNLTTRVTNINTGDWCEGFILVEDQMTPTISCADTAIYCTSSLDPEIIGYPEIWDNCSNLNNEDLSYTDNHVDLACYTNHNGQEVTSKIERQWMVTDDSGNTAQCMQSIFLTRITLGEVVFPLSLDGFDRPVLDCGGNPNDLSITGQPLVNGMPIEDGGGNCELIVNFTDQEVAICAPGSRRVVRTWSVIDMCSQQFILGAQTIKVLDQTPPVINPLAGITVGMDTSICGAEIFLPQTTATDDCSYYIITPTCEFGAGYGPFIMPVGAHLITYVAEDDCGNTSTTVMAVEVIDGVVPTAICDVNTSVSLSNFGRGVAYPPTFDAGSNDNCNIAAYKISRDGVAFADSLIFDCDDIMNSPVMVTLRVFDDMGNYNQCEANVIVEEQIRPVIGCPPNVTLECNEDYTNLNLTYDAIAYDNCAIDRIEYTDNLSLNDCSIGTIERTWIAYDLSGNTSTCIQTITMIDPTPMIVSFPEHKEYYTCGANVNISVAGEPEIANDCENVDVSYDDNIYGEEYPACYTITRTWSVINWCDYNSVTGDGYWEHVQEIYVYDTLAPVLNCPADLTVGITAASCENGSITIPVVTASDCNTTIDITNDSPYAFANGNNASGNYPTGEHSINYTATDGCGNTSTCAIQLSVQDATPPTPVCISGISLPLGPGGEVNITTANLNFGSFDNCTAASDLDVQISRMNFTCEDVGAHNVIMTVTDETGNVAECISIVTIVGDDPMSVHLSSDLEAGGQTHIVSATVIGGSGNFAYVWNDAASSTTATLTGMISGMYIVTVTDLVGGCVVTEVLEVGNIEYADIEGFIQMEDGTPMGGIALSLSGSVERNSVTDNAGIYSFENIVLGGDYNVTPSYDGAHNAGVTTFDLVLIGKHILSLQALDSPYKIIAADVNKSGGVTTFDQVLIRRIILGQAAEFSGNTAWRFVCGNYTFQDPANPLAEDFPEVQQYPVLGTGQVNTNFVAIKTGDVNNSVGFLSEESENRNNIVEQLNFVIKNESLESGEAAILPICTRNFNAITGFQFALNFDENQLTFTGIKAAVLDEFSEENLGLEQLEKGVILVSWNDIFDTNFKPGEVLFNLKFKAKNNTTWQDAIQLDKTYMLPEGYAGIESEKIKLLDVNLHFEAVDKTVEKVSEVQFYPNPVKDICYLSFVNNKIQTARIVFTDLQGRKLKQVEKYLEKGVQNLSFNLAEMVPISTVVYCEIVLENGERFGRKLIVVK